MASQLTLGAPGLYRTSPVAAHTPAGERLDVCAFIGVAPRGPARVPVVDERWREDAPTVGGGRALRRSVAVPVDSFREYQRVFGGFDGPGRLPWAVRSYFKQGGRRAWIVRVVHDYGGSDDEGGVATLPLTAATASVGSFALAARSEGEWGNALEASFGFVTEPVVFEDLGGEIGFVFGEAPPLGSTLRLRMPDDSRVLRVITGFLPEGLDGAADRRVRAVLSAVLPEVPVEAELVTASLWLDDRDGRRERHEGLGLSSLHPRWIATVLCHESELAWPTKDWVEADLTPIDIALPGLDASTAGWQRFAGGEDRYADLSTEDFFDPSWDPLADQPGSGITALADAPEVASVVLPDLYHPESFVEHETVLDDDASLGSAQFETCLDAPTEPPLEQEEIVPSLPQLRLDPRLAADFDAIIELQQRVISRCEQLAIVGLLDVPPGLRQREILAWRKRLFSSWAAAYHPWLRLANVVEEPDRDTPIRLGPSAVAAGIVARQELRFGVPHGPANTLAAGVVDVEDRVSAERHDHLHVNSVNVYLRERDGVRLSAARTLARDPSLRQLSVRRLMQLLHRTLLRRMQWIVFEPHDARLREQVRDQIRTFLRSLYRQGAFRGATESQAFFVRCDESNNPRHRVERGELLVEIGVAPAEPLEFIVLQITHDGDGNLEVVSG